MCEKCAKTFPEVTTNPLVATVKKLIKKQDDVNKLIALCLADIANTHAMNPQVTASVMKLIETVDPTWYASIQRDKASGLIP